MAGEALVFEKELCKKNEIIAKTLVDQSERATVVCDVLRKFKQKVTANQLELEQARMKKVDLENQVKRLSAILKSNCEELKKKDSIISNGQEELIMISKSKDKLSAKNSILQERIDKMVTKFSKYSKQLEQKCDELKDARQGEANLNKHVITLTEELSSTKQEAHNNMNDIENILEKEVEKRIMLESAIKELKKNYADAKQSIEALKTENKSEKATKAHEIEKLSEQLASQKHTFYDELLSTHHEFQQKLNVAETQITNLKAIIETETTSTKSCKAKIVTLQASLTSEKEKSGFASAEVSKLNGTLKEKIAKIAEYEKIIIEKSYCREEHENDVISLKDKEDLTCLLKQLRNEKNDEQCSEVRGGKNLIQDKSAESLPFRKDLSEDAANGVVDKKPLMGSAMSIVKPDFEGPKLCSAMSIDG